MTQVIAGRYELVEPFGRHGTGLVWRTRDLVLDREIAVQEVSLPEHLESGRREQVQARIAQEARAATRLDHPGIVTVYDVVEEDGRPWIAMQLVRAPSLAAIIERDGPLRPERVAAIGLDLLDALRTAHAAGIVHRDVEPGNVLLAAGRAVLTGFGLAADEALAPPGALARRAPERAHGHQATAASDLWALGATLYAAVEGRPPYPHPTAPPPEPDPPRLAGPLAPVLHGLLRADPDRRIGPDEAGRLLRRATASDTAPVAPPATPPPFPPGFPSGFPPPGPVPQSVPEYPQGVYAPLGGPPPGTGPRWALIIPAGVLAVVLVAAAVASALLIALRDDGGRAASGTPVAGTPSQIPSTPPPPYREYYGEGFVVSVPFDWNASPKADGATFTDPGTGALRSMSLQEVIASDEPAADADVGDALKGAAESFADDPETYPGYRQERFTELGYMGDDAAELQFTFTAADIESRMVMRLFRFDGAIYSAILSAELEHWEASLPHFETFLRTLRED